MRWQWWPVAAVLLCGVFFFDEALLHRVRRRALRHLHAPTREEGPLLISIISFSTVHLEHTHTQLKNIRDMCEGGINVTVHVHTTDPVDRYLMLIEHGMMWCSRLGRNVPVHMYEYSKEVGKTLPCRAHDAMWAVKDQFEWFLQTEDDVDIRLAPLLQYWRTLERVQRSREGTRDAPGWVIYDRADDALVLTQMGSENATAQQHSTIFEGSDGKLYVTMPGYMCGFMATRDDLDELDAARVFRWRDLERVFDTLQWPMEQCNGLSALWTLRETRVVPLASFRALMVHHLTNRYFGLF